MRGALRGLLQALPKKRGGGSLPLTMPVSADQPGVGRAELAPEAAPGLEHAGRLPQLGDRYAWGAGPRGRGGFAVSSFQFPVSSGIQALGVLG